MQGSSSPCFRLNYIIINFFGFASCGFGRGRQVGWDDGDGAGTLTHPSTLELQPNYGPDTHIEADCLATPPPSQPDPNPYSNGVVVFDAVRG